MKYRKFGNTDLLVSEIGFGTWGIGGNNDGARAYGPTYDNESIEALEEAFNLGINFYDTANIYGFGHSEKLLGETFKNKRDKVIFASKAGLHGNPPYLDFNSHKIEESLHGSLRRLKTDYLDLLQLHNFSINEYNENIDIFNTLEKLKRRGLVRYFGISVKTPSHGIDFIHGFNFDSIQINFNLTDFRALDCNLFELYVKKNIGIIGRTPLSFGFLTGAIDNTQEFHIDDHRNRFEKQQHEKWKLGSNIYSDIFNDTINTTPAQNAIRFCLSFDEISTVIPGMLTKYHVRENIMSVELPKLNGWQLNQIKKIYYNNTEWIVTNIKFG